jgi:predicted deacylase
MPTASSKKLSRLVIGFWVVNFFVGVFVVAAWFWMNTSFKAIIIPPTPIVIEPATLTARFKASFTSTSTQTLIPTFTPTLTKTLRPTQTPTRTLTPIPFSEGPITIGKSVNGLPLEVYRFGTGATERLIVAGMHGGNEYNTVQLVEELMDYLKQHPEIVPPDVTLYILHDLNPDGVARGLNYFGRANANGVDLNRNWPANWHQDWPRAGCWTTTYVTGGSAPGSEPETKGLMTFIQNHHFDALINYHSAALGIFAGGLPPDDYSIRLAKAMAAVSTYAYPPIDTGCDYTGGFTDWADENNIAALDIELTNHTDTDYDMNLRILEAFLNWKR